ncbi:galactosylceramide sulfotransferase-like [Antedon mediterranea]|uniref:galactosylceramide sulfotransferase-like n=1 Tax=Antedon mediterranea TaxID=105859 RepID=UPI003AF42DE0
MTGIRSNMRTKIRYILAFTLTVLILFVLYLKGPKTPKPSYSKISEDTVVGYAFNNGEKRSGAAVAPINWKSHVRKSEKDRDKEVKETSKISSKQNEQYHRDCKPKVNITLLKVHKTGSSTLQNIFLRYGDKNNLNFAIPPIGHHLGYPQYFEKKHMIPVNGACNIYCHHSRFSSEVLDVMPPNSVYISILRDPVPVFESAFTYFKMDGRAGMPGDPDAMTKFLQRPKHFYNKMRSKVHARNVMLFDFGFPEEDFDDDSLIQKAIKMIEKQFNLIVIAEYFDESLILLKELLCFSLEDIAFFKMNSRKENSVHQLSDQLKKSIIDWNKGDVMLYEHFNRTLWQRIKAFGVEKMAAEVEQLREINQKLFDKCIATDTGGQGDGKYRIFQPPGVKINTFVLKESAKKDQLCEQMVKPEISYTQDLRRKQFPNFKSPQGMRHRQRPPVKRKPF